MDYTTEVVNITKIKDGFFLGDEATAASLDVIIQFKITNMINAAGTQIINAWESIGIKYLTLNWSDNPNQILFDQKDEIANKIVSFIDDSFNSGEGLLVHSLKAQNRGCIVILIYLIKKYRWSLTKALEFLNNKKFDVEIPKYFLNQLSMFETRLSKVGLGPKTNTFNEISSDNDMEEKLIHNTYLNGLNLKSEARSIDDIRKSPNISNNPKKITWADNNNFNRKDLLCNTNFTKDLFYQKDIKPILNHKKSKPIKAILKKRFSSADISKQPYKSYNNVGSSLNSSNINNINNYSGTTATNFSSINNNNVSSCYINNYHTNDKENVNNLSNNSIVNNFINNKNLNNNSFNNSNFDNKKPVVLTNNSNYNISQNSTNINNQSNIAGNKENSSINNSNFNSRLNNFEGNNNHNKQNLYSNNTNFTNASINSSNPPRSYSLDQKNDNNNRNQNQNYNNQGEMTKIIITPNIHSIYNHNINNYYIQSANELNFEKLRDNNPNSNNQPISMNNMNYEGNNLKINNERPNSVGKKDPILNPSSSNISPLNAQGNNFSYMNNNLLRGQNLNQNNNQLNSSVNNKLVKSLDNQRLLQNNFVNQNNFIDNKQLKIIDYKAGLSNNTSVNSGNSYNISQYNSNKNSFNQNKVIANNQKLIPNNNFTKPNTYSINNYQPELNKKNYHDAQAHGIGLLNRPSSQMKQGPVKIQNNEYDRKPSTPDAVMNNLSSIKLGNSLNANNKSMLNNPNPSFNLGIGLTSNNQPYGTIKRPNSNKRTDNFASNDRPSTAPQKNEKIEERGLNTQGSMKRLPSPNVKSNNTLGNSSKNISSGINYAKYRSPSPSTVGKPSTIVMGSIKSVGGKPKWK